MDEKDKQEIINLYEDRLTKHGVSVTTMGWRDREQQALRFKILSEIGDLQGKKILDIGCGFGDFYDYLEQNSIYVDYHGIDLSEKIIAAARERRHDMLVEVRDILTDGINERFDYVFESGILNKRISDNYAYAHEIITAMYRVCNEGIAFNMVTDYVDYKEDYLYYYSPEKIFSFCKGLSRFVVLRHDYPLYEFTVYMHKNQQKTYR
jgi:SAM-dependent methyltransferase